jgi:hypothetical protein
MAKLKMQVEYRICGNWICIQYLKLWKTIKLITKSENVENLSKISL